MRELEQDPAQAFPCSGQMKPDQLEITRLRKDIAGLASEEGVGFPAALAV
jgi:transposase